MNSKTYTIGYAPSGYDHDTPCIKITGKWLKEHGFMIGDKLNLTFDNGMLILSKLSTEELQTTEQTNKSKK